MSHIAAESRYVDMPYRRCGKSGLLLPAISLGFWHNFGDDVPHERKRAIATRAFDLGICHFDFANDYGPPKGAAEIAGGKLLREEFKAHRDELLISSKAGYRMWGGPFGEWGGRKYLIASCDQSLRRLGLDYVDIFYSHRPDPETPLEETMGALDYIVRSGRALYVGISSYRADQTREAARILAELGTPCVIHQPRYSILDRWVENDGLLDRLDDLGIGSIVFSPLAQGLLSDKYVNGVPAGSRASQGKSLDPSYLTEERRAALRGLNEIACRRRQTLAQMAIAWVLRGGRVTSALIGASHPGQIDEAAAALRVPEFTAEELAEIEKLGLVADLNAWKAQQSGN